LKVGYRRLDAAVIFSDASRAAVARYTPAPATPIFLAFDDELFNGRSGQRSLVPELLVVSRLVPWKGVDRALELFGLLRTEIPEARLVIAGDGPLARSFTERYGSTSGVEFRLRVPAAEMPALYRHAWAMVHPSEYETFGLVVVEAMASGTPVIAARVSPLPDLIDHDRTGILVPSDDDAAWLAAIKRVIREREYADGLASAAMDEARTSFNADRMTELYDRFLTGLIDSR
jgi:glycosyltransferase involved in cell wall biosynthesis